jgi:hypothetical protein
VFFPVHGVPWIRGNDIKSAASRAHNYPATTYNAIQEPMRTHPTAHRAPIRVEQGGRQRRSPAATSPLFGGEYHEVVAGTRGQGDALKGKYGQTFYNMNFGG